MIKLMKYTYLLENDKISKELELMYQKYSGFLEKAEEVWKELNEARAILYLTGQVYCEQIALETIQRRLHLLKQPLQLLEFLNLIDSNSEKLNELRNEELFRKLEEFYKIIKEYKNKFIEKISDDFNLPQALALTQQLLKSKLSNSDKLATLLDFDQVLGLGLDKTENKSIPVEIQELVQKREQARKDNDYQGADEIRKQIENEGFRVKDTLKGSEVYKV